MTARNLAIDLAGRRAVVTGASRGIGAAVARYLALAGADVAIGYLNRAADAESVADVARGIGVRAVSIAADVSTASGAQSLFDKASDELGPIDIFIGNAGVWPPGDVLLRDMGIDQWSNTIRQNLDSIFFTTRAAVRAMTGTGSIVLVSSTAGQRGEAGHADYAATKGAVISITKSLAVELGPQGINVNCVAPGWVDTEMVKSAIDVTGMDRITGAIPLRRIATADDIAAPIVFLCSSMARHITGEVLNINGGSVLPG